MSKLLLISIILAPIIIPAVAARSKDPGRGLRKTLTNMVIFNLFYLFVLLFLYGRV